MDETETDDPTLVGENCHIVAENDGGPRADPLMSTEKRNSYANLILLCNVHHKQVDSQFNFFSVDKLLEMKRNHESWVEGQLLVDKGKQFDDEQYSGFVDTWERLSNIDNWKSWTSWLLGGQPSISKEMDNNLSELREWLLGRVWPGRYGELEKAFSNYRFILQDLQNVFHRHAEERHKGETLVFRKFYKIDEWNEPLYFRLLKEYEDQTTLISDLVAELTRAANYILDQVRKHLNPSYRLQSGRLMFQYGPTMGLSWHTVVSQYTKAEQGSAKLYPGIEKFRSLRFERDFWFAEKE